MHRKFGQPSILLIFLFLSFLVGAIYLTFATVLDTRLRRESFLADVETQVAISKLDFFNRIEFSIRESELPFHAKKVAEEIQSRQGLEFLKIFDDSLRLIHSTVETKEVFQADLRHDSNPLIPGSSRILSNGETAYRTLNGKLFLIYKQPYIPKTLLRNPNLEYGFTYWVFDKTLGEVFYTNDFLLLNGDKESKELLSLFEGNEGKSISWQFEGEDGFLERMDFPNYSIYILERGTTIPKKGIAKAFLIVIVTMIFLCLFRFVYQLKKGFPFKLNKDQKIGILCFLCLLVFYQTVSLILPDFRSGTPWSRLRYLQSESQILRLEKNLLGQITSDSTEVEIRNRVYDPIVKELYLWKKKESNTEITNRFSIELQSFIEKLEVGVSSRMIDFHFEHLFLIPITKEGDEPTFVIVVLDPLLLAAKKEKDRDEFFDPITYHRLSEDTSKEKLTFYPQKRFSELLMQGNPFHSFKFSQETQIPRVMDGLFIYKTEGVFPILVYASFLAFLPLIAFSFLYEEKKKREALVEPPVLGEIVPKRIEIDTSEIVVIQDAKLESKVEMSPENPKEAIAEIESIPDHGGGIVKKKIRQYLPPKLWKPTNVGLPSAIQKKRDSIFNVELKELVEQVTSPEAGFGKRETDFKKTSPVWLIPEEKKFEFSLLDRVYRGDEVSLDGIVEYTKNFIQRLGSPRFSFLFLNDTIGSYHSQISFGLDYNTRSNLIFLYNDPYLQNDESGIVEIDINEKMKLDRFIAKKFSWEILAQIETIVAFQLEKLGFPGLFLILLNKQEKEKFLDSHKRMIMDKLRQLIPAFHVLKEKEYKTPDLFEDSLSWMVRSFLQATLGGRRSAFVTHATWKDYHPTDENELKKADMLAEVASIIESNDRIIENSPDAFLLISKNNPEIQLKEILKKYPFPFETRYMNYPEDGENYYLYI